MHDLIFKFIKFVVVGFTGLLVDFGLTYTLKEKAKIHKYVANACGFITAASTNYLFNRWWTFHSKNPHIMVEYSKFIIVSLVGLAINSFVLWMLVSRYKKHFYLSKLFAIIVTTLWNFAVNVVVTFN